MPAFQLAKGARVNSSEPEQRPHPGAGPGGSAGDERREEAGLTPLPPGLTPHSLRRTFASVLFALGRELPYVMAQLGHADPKMTLGVYARVMLDGDAARGELRALVEGECVPRLDGIQVPA